MKNLVIGTVLALAASQAAGCVITSDNTSDYATVGATWEIETYTAPAPEQRNVIVGNTISLGGVELLLEVSSCQQRPCICQ